MQVPVGAAAATRARWLLLSDIHFRPHDLDRINRTAQWIASLPQRHNISRVVICGDLLTSRTMQPTHVLSACYRFLSALSDAVPHVNILLGNHDLAYKRDYTTSALDALLMRRLAPFVSLHAEVVSEVWDRRRVLVLPFREDQRELTDAVAGLDSRDADETVAFAHLAIHRAVTQRHVVSPDGSQKGRPVTYLGLTGPDAFSALARTFTGHFHSHQTIIQPAKRELPANAGGHLQGSITYLGSPLQLTWADLYDEQRGVVLLDPATLEHELVVNPHAVSFATADIAQALHDGVNSSAVAGKHVMLLGERTQYQHVTARDKLLSLGARSVRNWSPMAPIPRSNDLSHSLGLGATVPASDIKTLTLPIPTEQAESTDELTEDIDQATVEEEEQEPLSQPVQQIDFAKHAREYVDSLELDPSLDHRRGELIRVGSAIIRSSSGAELDTSYIELMKSAASPSVETETQPPSEAETKRIFVAQPHTLTMTNFLGVQETLTLDFHKLPRGLAFVVGSNGTGKSTLLEAMVWCQFGRCVRGGLAVSDVVNDVVGQNCRVSLTLKNGYSLTRYRKDKKFGNRVIVSFNGEEQTQFERADNRATQAAIDELLGIDYDTYVRTVVLCHESAAGFLSSTSTQRRDLIESWLGLSTLDDYGVLSRRLLKDVDTDIAKVQSKRDGIAQTLRHIDGRVADLEKRRQQLIREAADAAKLLERAEIEQQRAEGDENQKLNRLQEQLESYNLDTIGPALSELHEQIKGAQEDVDTLKTRSRFAEFRIAHAHEQSLQEIKLKVIQHELQDRRESLTRLAGVKTPASWQWRVLNGTIAKLHRLLHWLKPYIKADSSLNPRHSSFGRAWRQARMRLIAACVTLVEHVALRGIEMTKQRRYHQPRNIDKLQEEIVAREQDYHALTSTRLDERLAQRYGVDRQQVHQVISDMTVEEAEGIQSQFSAAVSHLSRLITHQAGLQRQQASQHCQRDSVLKRLRDLERARERTARDLESQKARLLNAVTTKENDILTFAQLIETEKTSLDKLREEHDVLDTHAATLSSVRDLFAFWESALGKRRTKFSTTFRSHVLEQSLDELNALVSQILTVLYEDTRHAQNVSSGMLQCLFEPEDQGPSHAGAVVIDKNLDISSSLSYAKRSGGERKRIDLALYFALLHVSHSRSLHRARYMLVDEVFDSLDAAGQAVVVRWCRYLTSRMDFVLVITHSEHLVGLATNAGDGDTEGVGRGVVITARMGETGTQLDIDG